MITELFIALCLAAMPSAGFAALGAAGAEAGNRRNLADHNAEHDAPAEVSPARAALYWAAAWPIEIARVLALAAITLYEDSQSYRYDPSGTTHVGQHRQPRQRPPSAGAAIVRSGLRAA